MGNIVFHSTRLITIYINIGYKIRIDRMKDEMYVLFRRIRFICDIAVKLSISVFKEDIRVHHSIENTFSCIVNWFPLLIPFDRRILYAPVPLVGNGTGSESCDRQYVCLIISDVIDICIL